MRVQQIWRYPVKSAAGEQLAESEVDHLGLVGDRRWALRDTTTGHILTARREPRLLFMTPEWEGAEEIALRLPDDRVTADPDVLSAHLDRSVELVRATGDQAGTYEIAVDAVGDHQSAPDGATGTWAGEWSSWRGPAGVFHDSTRTQVSIIAADALGDWPVRRFRPNLVLDCPDEGDLVGQRLQIGDVTLDVGKRIDRCVVVTRPQPGIERDLDVLRAVVALRGGDFGVGAIVSQTGRIRIGDLAQVV